MSQNTLYEKFQWFRDDIRATSTIGNHQRIKGKALFPTISGNNREYIEKECMLSARTLGNCEIDINHAIDIWEEQTEDKKVLSAESFKEKWGILPSAVGPKPKAVGNVLDADWEDGAIEYVADINNSEYAQKLYDREKLTKEAYVKKWGRDPIYGVSVSAGYRYHERQCDGVSCRTTPYGIRFKRLSLVEDPEKPGVRNTVIKCVGLNEKTIEETRIVEAMLKDLSSHKEKHNVPSELLETYKATVKNPSSVFTESQKSKVTKMTKLQEQEDEENGGCPEGQHKNENGECVPDKEEKEDEGMMDPESTPDVSMEMLTIKHQIEKDNLKRVKETKTINESIIKTKQSLTKRIEEVDGNQKKCCNRLGETQKQLLEVEAIAKGTMDKQAKEAEELTAKDKELEDEMDKLKDEQKKTEETLAQTVSQTQLTEALGKLPNVEEKLKPIEEKLAGLPDVNALLQPITEKLGGLPDVEALIKESLSKLPDVNALLIPLQETITKQATQLAEFDKKYGTLNTVYEALNTKYEGFVKESEAAKLKETQENNGKLVEMQAAIIEKDKTLKEMQDQIDTLKLHVSPKFKAKLETKKVEPNFSAPYTYTKS